MKKIDETLKNLAKYEDQYIAVVADSSKIIAAGKSIKILERKLQKLAIKDAIIQYIPPVNKVVSPLCL